MNSVLATLARFVAHAALGMIGQLIYNRTDTYFIGLLDDCRQLAGYLINAVNGCISCAFPHFQMIRPTSPISILLLQLLGTQKVMRDENCNLLRHPHNQICAVSVTAILSLPAIDSGT
jgi:hypothetical protein